MQQSSNSLQSVLTRGKQHNHVAPRKTITMDEYLKLSGQVPEDNTLKDIEKLAKKAHAEHQERQQKELEAREKQEAEERAKKEAQNRAAENLAKRQKQPAKKDTPNTREWEWDWSAAAKQYDEDKSKLYSQILKSLNVQGRLNQIKADHTAAPIQTKDGIKYITPYQARQDELSFVEDEANRQYDNKIYDVLSKINTVKNRRDRERRAGVVGNSVNYSKQLENLNLLLDQLLQEKEQYRQQLKDEIDPNAKVSSIFQTFWADEEFNPALAQKRKNILTAKEQFEALQANKQKEIDNAGTVDLILGGKKRIEDKYRPLLAKAASKEYEAERIFDREVDDYRILDQWIRLNGWPRDPNMLPEYIRDIAEKALPGSTTPEGTEQLINSQYIGDKNEIANRILSRIQNKDGFEGGAIDVSESQILSAIDEMQHRKDLAEAIADDEQITKTIGKTSRLLGADSLYEKNVDKADPNYKFYDQALKTLNRAKQDMELNERAKKGAWNNFNPFDEKDNTVLIGVERAVSRQNFWDSGLSDLDEALRNKKISDKISSGQQLSKGEQAYLNALAINEVVQQNHTDALTSGGALAGEVSANSAAFVALFVASKGMLSMLAKGAIKGAEKSIVKKISQFMLGQIGDKMMNTAALRGVKKYGAKTFEAKMLTAVAKTPGFLNKVAGDLTYSVVLANTLQGAKTISDITNLHTGNVAYEVDDDGKIIGTGFEGGVSWDDAIYTAETRQTIENFSEMMGEWGMGKLLGKITKLGGRGVKHSVLKMLGKDSYKKIVSSGSSATEQAMNMLRKATPAKLRKYASDAISGNGKFGEFMKSGQYHGFVGEMSEEYYGMALLHLMGVSDSGNSFWEDLTDPKQFWDIFGGIALSSVLMGIGSLVHYAHYAKRFNDAEKKAKETFGSSWDGMERAILFAEDKNLGSVMSRLESVAKTPKEKEVLLNYFNRLMGYRGVSAMEENLSRERQKTSHQQSVEDAQKTGYMTATQSARNDLQRAIEVTDKRLADQYGAERAGVSSMREYVEQFGGIEEFINAHNLSTEEKNRLYAFDNMIAAHDGMTARAIDDFEDIVQERSRQVDRIAHKNGNVIEASDKSGNTWYVVDGTVVSNKDGNIDRNISDKQVKVANSNGDVKLIDTEELTKIEGKKSANTIKVQQSIEAYAFEQIFNKQNEARLGVNIGDKHDLGDGRTLTVVGSSRDGGILYSISDGTTETIGHKSNPREMQQLINEVNEGRIEKVIERAIELAQNDDLPISNESQGISEEEALQVLEEKEEERRVETESNPVAAFIPTITKQGKEKSSSTAYSTAKKVANAVEDVTTFEEFRQALEDQGLNFDHKYDGRLLKLFKAVQKGNVTPAQLASVFVKPEQRKSLHKNALDVDGINIDDDGNIIIPKQPADISAGPEYLYNDDFTSVEKDDSDRDPIVEKLDKHLKQVSGEFVGRTGQAYMFRIGGKLVMYQRLHGTMAPQYEYMVEDGVWDTMSKKERNFYEMYVLEMREAYQEDGINGLKKYAKEHAKYYQDVDYYFEYLEQTPEDVDTVINYIALDYSRSFAGNSTVYGQLMDILQRRFFDRELISYQDVIDDPHTPQIHQKHIHELMSEDVFNEIKAGLKALDETYAALGWKVSYKPHIFYIEREDGTRVAGEVDGIAVDKEGNVFVLDTKTSYKQYTEALDSSNPLFLLRGGDQDGKFWDRYTGQYKRQVRTLGESYTEQLTSYAAMVNKAIGKDAVTGIKLTPWTLDYQGTSKTIWLRGAKQNPRIISLNINQDVLSHFLPVDAAKLAAQQLLTAKEELLKYFDTVNSACEDFLKQYGGSIESMPASVQFGIQDLQTRLNSIKDAYLTSVTPADCEMYTNALTSLVEDLEMVLYQVNMLLEEEARMKAEEEAAAAAELNNPSGKTNEELSKNPHTAAIHVASDKYSASTFSTSNGESIGISDAVAEDDPNLRLSSISGSADFLDEAEFEFIMKKSKVLTGNVENRPHVVITYKGHKFTPIALSFANSSFYTQIKHFCENAGPLRAVVPLKVERSSGDIIQLDPKNHNVTQSAIAAGLISTEKNGLGIYIYDISYSDSQDVFGITKKHDTPSGLLTQVECPGNILHVYQDKYKQRNAEKTGSTGMPAGSVVMMVERNYSELARQGKRLRVPVRFHHAKLEEGDARLIVDILSGKYGQLDELFAEGNKRSVGLTNRDVINLLIPTTADAESALHFDIDATIDPSTGELTINSIKLIGNVKGTEITETNPLVVRPGNTQEMEDLYLILSKYVNRITDLSNTTKMRLGTAHLLLEYRGHPFAKVARAVRSNKRLFQDGPIRIGNSSIVFEPSDFNDPNTPGDQEGLSVLGWYVKHGFLQTPFNGIEGPLFSFDENAGIEYRQRTQTKSQPKKPAVDEKTTVQKTKDANKKIEDLLKQLGLLKLQDHLADKPLDKQLAKERLEKIFGENGVPVEFYDEVIAVFKEGPYAVGKCTADAILLSRYAEQGVEWHEAFHRVVELLLPEKEREAVYKAFRKSKVGKLDMTDSEVAEGLADGFMYYMLNKPTFKLTWNIKKLFRQVAEWVKFFSSIGSFRLFVLYTQTNSGRFRNVKPSKDAHERVLKIGGYFYTVGTEDFQNVYNVTQLKDLVHSLVFLFLNPETQEINFADPSSVNNLKIDVDTLRNSPIYKNWLDNIPQDHPTHKLLVEAVQKYDGLQPLVLSALREFITDYTEKEEEEDSQKQGVDTTSKTSEETTSEDDIESAGIGEHTKASWETSQFARASDMVKFLFAGVDSGRRNSLGLPEVYPVRSVFNSVLNEVHECNSIEDMIKKLADIGRQLPMFNEIAVRILTLYRDAWGSVADKKLLDADKEALLTLTWDVVKAHKGNFKLIKNHKVGLRWYLTIESTDQSYVSRRSVLDWSRRFAAGASKYVKLDSFGRLIMKGKFAPTIFKRLYYFLAGRAIDPNIPESMRGLIYAFSSAALASNNTTINVHGLQVDVFTEEGLEIAKNQFVAFLNSMGIVFDRETFDYMLLHKYGSVGSEGMRKMLTSSSTDSVDAFARFINGFYRPRKDANGNVVGTELNISEKDGVQLLNGRPVNQVFNESGFVLDLANWKYEYDHAHQQLNVLGTGGKRMYVMHENNTVTDRIGELETESFRTKLKGVRYIWSDGVGSRLMKHVGLNGHRKLEFITHSGLKTDERGDQGIDYDTINNREDYISKLTVLLNGHILLPTMSDKKTYGWIEGCDTAGFDWNKTSYTIQDVLGPEGKWEYDANGDIMLHVSDEALDQLLEYAETERQQILHVLSNGASHHKVDNFHSGSKITDSHGNTHRTINGARFTGLVGVYDKDGNYISFNTTLKQNGVDENGNPVYEYTDEWECYQTACKEFFNKSDEEKKHMLSKLILMQTRKELEYVEKLGLILKVQSSSTDPMAQYANIGLDNRKVSIIRDTMLLSVPANEQSSEVKNRAESLAIAFVLLDSIVRYILSIQEFERVFSGSPSYYKMEWNEKGQLVDRTKDLFKRLGGLVSTGTNNNLSIPGIDKNGEYVCAEVEDEMIQSKQIDHIDKLMMSGALKKTLFNNITKNLLHFDEGVKSDDEFDFGEDFGKMTVSQLEDAITNMENDKIEEILSKTEEGKQALESAKYIAQHKIDAFKKGNGNKGIDVNDGAAYISDKMCETLLRMVGSYGKDVQRAFKILRGEKVDGRVYTVKDTVELSEAYSLVMTNVIGILKYTGYGFRFQDGLAVPYYNKMALFPMFKNICTGGMANIYDIVNRQGIDMLLIKSAVKIGGQEAKDTDWEAFKYPNYTFNTYKLKYQYLRKQFNTDPKEKDLMSMGTQMTKVIMSLLLPGRSFNVRGERMSAEDVRNDIMDCVRKLSDNGEKQLRKKFFNDDGTLNVDKFSKVLTEELSGRGASTRLLDAVKAVIRGKGDNKVKQLNIPLLAQSGMNWIQSILVSMVNKKVIDINAPGAAFYQRSVWGMLGKTTVVGDENLPESINGGDDLQMIIEDGPAKGAMDCVLSLDFFDEILNKAEVKTGRKVKKTRKVKKNQYATYTKYGVLYTDYTKIEEVEVDEEYETDEYVPVSSLSFNEQKKWLMDHNIIGKNADANIIGYRIPTQAISSIHALRCVDVLPSTVRHTVILPSEFTKITGSDFDIDKLFMSRISYNKKGTTEFKEGTDEYLTNKLIEDYISILKDSEWSTSALNGPIDNDTELVTDIVEELYGKSSDEIRTYDYYRLGFQAENRKEFSTGKFGIGPFALNLVNHILTMLYGVKFKKGQKDNILSRIDALDLSKSEDRDGKSILSWLSALINLHVDVAKDPVISKLNVNKYTYNLTNLLVRTGLGRTSFYFLTQPIMWQLSKAHADVTGKYMVDQRIPTQQRVMLAEHKVVVGMINQFMNTNFVCDDKVDEYDSAVEHYKTALTASITNQTDQLNKDSAVDELVAAIFNKQNSSVLRAFSKHTDHVVKKQPCVLWLNENTSVNITMFDLQMLTALANELLKPYANSISSLVKYTKIDTKKQGKTLAAQQDYLYNYERLFNADEGAGTMFEESGLHRLRYQSYVETKTVNATNLLIDILGAQLLQGTNVFKNDIQRVLDVIGLEPTENVYTAVQNAILAKIKSKFFFGKDGYCEKHNIRVKDLFCGNNSIYDRLINILADLLSDDKYRNPEDGLVDERGVITNYMLNTLVSGAVDSNPLDAKKYTPGSLTSTYMGAKFIQVLNYMNDEEIDSDAFTDGWVQLLENDKYPELLQFARDLIVYAFVESTDNGGKFDLFKYVPEEWKLGFNEVGFEDSYVKYMTDVLDEYHQADETGIPTLLTDDDIEDIILNNWDDGKFIPTVSQSDYMSWVIANNKGYPAVLAGIKYNNGSYELSGPSVYDAPNYIKIKRFNTLKGQRSYTIYKLFGSGITKVTRNGKPVEYPIYVHVDPRGDVFDEGHRITEYGRDDRHLASENSRIAQSVLGKEEELSLRTFLQRNNVEPGSSLQEVMQLVADIVAKLQKPQIIDNLRKKLPQYVNPVFASILKGYATKMMLQTAVMPLEDSNVIETTETTSTYESDEIPQNIWWSSGENKDLSNIAPRPFTFQNLSFNSVEHAFHYCKMEALKQAIRFVCGNTKAAQNAIAACNNIQSQLATASGVRVKQLGNTRITSRSKEVQQVIDEFFDKENKHHFYAGIDDWNSMSSKWMKTFIYTSFEQVPRALEKLLATGNAELTHTQALKSDLGQNEVNWGTEFPKLLMEVRKELRLKYGQNIPVQSNQLEINGIRFIESAGGYRDRTIENITNTDVTLAFVIDETSLGERLTEGQARKQNKYQQLLLTKRSLSAENKADIKRQVSNTVQSMKNDQAWEHKGVVLPTNDIKLNIAGNGIYTFVKDGITQEQLNDYVTEYLREMIAQGVTISEIRSGGLTGIDEAGIVAALRLGIPAIVNAPHGFLFRDESGKDVADKDRFVGRFNQDSNTDTGAKSSDFNPNGIEQTIMSSLTKPEETVIQQPDQDGVIQGKLGVDKSQLIALLGNTMYTANVQSVAEKELVQNAFDATKIAIALGQISKGKITVELNSNERTVTVSDNGSGMTPEIVQKAFFTIGGSYKGENVDNRLKSGGLGLAKMAFLFTADYIELTTIKDGKKTYVKATPQLIQNDDFKIIVSNTSEQNGTSVTVKIPKTYVDQEGNDRGIYFSSWGDGFFENPMIGNVDVTRIVDGEEKWTKNFNAIPEGYTMIGTATSDFGDIEIYKNFTNKSDKITVLISGLYLFYTWVDGDGEHYSTIVNILPSVGTKSETYPINNQREGFRSTVEPEIKDLKFFLLKLDSLFEKKKLKTSFGKSFNMDSEALKNIEKGKETKTSDLINQVLEEIRDKYQHTPSTTSSGNPTFGMKLSTVTEERKQKEKKQADKARNSSFDASSINIEEQNQYVDTSNMDLQKAVFYNNTDFLPSDDTIEFLTKFGSLLIQLRNSFLSLQSSSRNYKDIAERMRNQYWGIAIDKSYHGVNVNPRLFNFLGINPIGMAGSIINEEVVDDFEYVLEELLYHNILHETNHNAVGGHTENFTVQFLYTYSEFAKLGRGLQLWREQVRQLIKKHLKSIIIDATQFDNAENLGETLEGSGQRSKIEEREENSSLNNEQTVDGSGDKESVSNVIESFVRSQNEWNNEYDYPSEEMKHCKGD